MGSKIFIKNKEHSHFFKFGIIILNLKDILFVFIIYLLWVTALFTLHHGILKMASGSFRNLTYL